MIVNLAIPNYQRNFKNQPLVKKQDSSNKNIMTTKNFEPNFCGLTHSMARKIYADGEKDISAILKKNPLKKKVVGTMPNFFIKKFDKNTIKESINEVYESFNEAVIILREENDTKKASKIVNDSLRKHKLIDKYNDDINFEYIDKGGKGKVYKIAGLQDYDKEDEFVIKVFHSVDNPRWHGYKNHGCFSEVNRAAYWIKNTSQDTHRGKFFWADLKSGYMVNKFIDLDVRIAKTRPKEEYYGLVASDESKIHDGYNRLKGYNYDWGGIKLENRTLSNNKVARVFYHKINDAPKDQRLNLWMKLFRESSHTPNEIDKRAGLANAIELMDNKTYLMDKMIGLKDHKINQGLSYVLKSLPYEDSIKYFEKLMKTDKKRTQIILLNEIGKMPKDKIENYYEIAEKNAMPPVREHLASTVGKLPEEKFYSAYKRLAEYQDDAIIQRMIHKFMLLDKKHKPYASEILLKNTKNETLINEIKEKTI